MNLDLMIESLPELLYGTLRTVELLLLTLIFGLVLAVPLAILRVQRAAMYWLPVHTYITFFRGTPLLVQLFLIYYGLAQFDVIRESWAWPYLRQPFVCALLTFGLHTAAYTANILRGAILAVPAGEVEAGRACGMSPSILYRRIILPRAFRLALPAYGNEVISMLKATSLASTVTVMELTGVASTIVARTYAPYEIFVTAAAIYLVLTYAITRAFKHIEHRLSRHLRAAEGRPLILAVGETNAT
jgi:polar amino acid transport system permease protein/octopine/nopaline transport system permease protein